MVGWPMAKGRVRPETGHLYLDFNYRKHRCREQTSLPDTAANRRAVESLAARITREIARGTFDYRAYFPASSRPGSFAVTYTRATNALAVAPRTDNIQASPQCSVFSHADGTRVVE